MEPTLRDDRVESAPKTSRKNIFAPIIIPIVVIIIINIINVDGGDELDAGSVIVYIITI